MIDKSNFNTYFLNDEIRFNCDDIEIDFDRNLIIFEKILCSSKDIFNYAACDYMKYSDYIKYENSEGKIINYYNFPVLRFVQTDNGIHIMIDPFNNDFIFTNSKNNIKIPFLDSNFFSSNYKYSNNKYNYKHILPSEETEFKFDFINNKRINSNKLQDREYYNYPDQVNYDLKSDTDSDNYSDTKSENNTYVNKIDDFLNYTKTDTESE